MNSLIEYANSLIGTTINGLTVVGTTKDIKSDTIVTLRCNICGREIKSPIYNFTRGYFHCNHGKRLNVNECIGRRFGVYTILGVNSKDYRNRTLVNVRCELCGEVRTEYFYRITGYSVKCDCEKRNNYEQSCTDKYKKHIGEIVGTDEIVGFNYYKDNDHNHRSMMQMKCIKCGNVREVRAQALFSNAPYKKCNCMPKTREVNEPLKKYNETVLNKKFGSLLVTELSDGTTAQNIVATCDCDCGKRGFSTVLANILCGDTRSCGCKTKSFGVHCIEKELDALEVNYTTEQKMRDLVSSKGVHLRFDFFIMNKDNIGIAVIEFDGPHHDSPFIYYSTMYSEDEIMERFKAIQENDRIKDDYVKNHNCSMLRIKYSSNETETSIRSQVRDFINKLNFDNNKGEQI